MFFFIHAFICVFIKCFSGHTPGSAMLKSAGNPTPWPVHTSYPPPTCLLPFRAFSPALFSAREAPP